MHLVEAPQVLGCFIAAIPAPTLVLNRELIIIGVSDSYLAATGTTRNQLLGLGLFTAFPDNPADLQANGVSNLRASLTRVLTTGKAERMARQRYDIRTGHEDPPVFEKRYWDPLNAPVRDAYGEIIAIFHQVEDVTEEVALGEERQQLRAIVASSTEAAVSLSLAGVILALNQAAELILGRPAAELIGCRIEDFLSEAEQVEHQRRQERIARSRRSEYWECRLQTSSQHQPLIAGIVAPVCSMSGELLGFVQTFHDLTERRRAEEELARIFSLSLDLLCISSRDGYFKRVSPAVTAILGWSEEEFLRRPFSESIHPDDLDATIAAVDQQTVRGEPVMMFENRFRHRDGTYRRLSWNSVPQNGGLMYAIARDVTQQREAEARIVRLLAEVESQARELAVRNHELEAFSLSVSHDLRAPLRRISGYAQMLREDYAPVLDTEGVRLVDLLNRNSVRMGQLIDALLDLARCARQDFTRQLCPMQSMAHEAFSAIDPELRAHVTRFTVDELPSIMGDHTLLNQVWINLVGNAVKFTRRQNSARIHISAEATPGFIVYRITDNGAGFDPAHADQLFGMFRRLHPEAEFEGTGIGLSLVKQIISRHGGRIWAESSPDLGASFFFALPADEAR
jgi:PAS domain S-box-containing protein